MRADRYYGITASEYEAKRKDASYWGKEQTFIEKHVKEGPVLDVPVGTGRFIGHYKKNAMAYVGVDISGDMLKEARKKHPDAVVRKLSLFDLDYPDRLFGTVVCSRLLHWFEPDVMCDAVRHISAMGRSFVVSLRVGKEGKPKGSTTYTHSETKFLLSISGLLLEQKSIITPHPEQGDFCLYKFRSPTWDDVFPQFNWHTDKQDAINRLHKVWTRRYRIPDIDVLKGTVTAEYWPSKKFESLLNKMQALADEENSPHEIVTKLKPKRTDMPPVVFRSKGHMGLLDGRRRSNHFARTPGVYPVLIIDCD